jgi:2-keto-3-deoxy-galactonokinase
MSRTTASDVEAIFDTDMSTTALRAWIDVASDVVDEVDAAATGADAARLQRLETLVAAHLASAQDQRLASFSDSGTSGSYQGETGLGFQGTKHGQAALALEGVIGTDILSGSHKPSAGLSVPDVKATDYDG